MNLMGEINKIDSMSKQELFAYAQEKAVNLMTFFSLLHKDSDVFETHGLDSVEFFVKLCFACISSNLQGSKEEYNLFRQLTCDYTENLDYKTFKRFVSNIDILKLSDIVDEFTDFIGEQMVEAKYEIVSFCLSFIAIDGNMSEGELSFINKLAS